MPFASESDEALQWPVRLNRWELQDDELPPLFGAWARGRRAIEFVTFVPNQSCMAHLPWYLTVWAVSRHWAVPYWQKIPRGAN
jgi:hypothetical protein